jgi:hypothetical protein
VTSSLANYLTSASAASTYATQSSLSSYVTSSSLTSTLSGYVTTTAASAYALATSLSSYLTTAAASTTYVSQDALDGVFSTPSGTVDIIPRVVVNSSLATTSGAIRLTYFTPYRSMTVSQATIYVTAAGSGYTLARMGLYTVDGSGNHTLVARTASDTTIGTTSNSLSTRSFATAGSYPASYSLVSGQRYALAAVFVSGSQPTLTACLPNLSSGTPTLAAGVTAQTDLPASIPSTHPNLFTGSVMIWGRFS